MKRSVSDLVSNKLSTAVEVDDDPKNNEPKKDAGELLWWALRLNHPDRMTVMPRYHLT